jgi:hypothetical protein
MPPMSLVHSVKIFDDLVDPWKAASHVLAFEGLLPTNRIVVMILLYGIRYFVETVFADPNASLDVWHVQYVLEILV